MISWLMLCLLAVAEPEPVVTAFEQLQPRPDVARLSMWTRSHPRAVVLIHGFLFRPFSEAPARKAVLHSWQRPDGTLVTTLAKQADVFGLAYSQNASVDEIANCPDIPRYIARLQMMGYREIVLVAHSAGAIVARQYIEDHPHCGVTKVIQVCAPNAGTSLADAAPAFRKEEELFLESLTKGVREQRLRERAAKRIPADVEFVCMVATGNGGTDGFVLCTSQWSDDLQRQGIPAIAMPTTHFRAIRTKRSAEQIARAVREPQPRWSASEVQAAKKRILGSEGDSFIKSKRGLE